MIFAAPAQPAGGPGHELGQPQQRVQQPRQPRHGNQQQVLEQHVKYVKYDILSVVQK